jgi:hypothetical protein
MSRGLASGLAACCVAAGCGVEISGDRPPGGNPMNPDAAGPNPDAAALGPWGPAQLVTNAATGLIEDDASLSSTTNEMIFAVVDAATTGNPKDLWYMARPSPTGTWSAPVKLPFNSTASDETPRFADNDLTLYFASGRGGATLDIYKVTRQTVGGAWTLPPQVVPGLNSAGVEKWFVPCPGTNKYMTIIDNEIGEGTIGSAPTVCAEISSTSNETGTFLSQDCKTIYFASNRSTANRLYVATRPAVGAPFNPPQIVGDFLADPGGNQEDPWLSADLRTFVFVSDKSGSKDVYISTR